MHNTLSGSHRREESDDSGMIDLVPGRSDFEMDEEAASDLSPGQSELDTGDNSEGGFSDQEQRSSGEGTDDSVDSAQWDEPAGGRARGDPKAREAIDRGRRGVEASGKRGEESMSNGGPPDKKVKQKERTIMTIKPEKQGGML